jgi:signal transduction histidine kinase
MALMLDDFVRANRAAILDRARAKVAGRTAPRADDAELKEGVPLFLDLLVTALGRPSASTAEIGEHAARHGSDLLRRGFSVDQVVHAYGNICQAVTELAIELDAPISTEDFHTLNRCLDDAIAESVSEFSRGRELVTAKEGTERLGILAHEMRNRLYTAMLAFATLEKGTVGVSGSTGALLARSLRDLSALVDRSLGEVRLESALQKREHVRVAELVEEVRIAGTLEAEAHGVQFAVSPVEFGIVVDADRLILASALGNLVQNAFKFTRSNTLVSLTTHATTDRVVIEVADECGGLGAGDSEELFRAFEQRGGDRTGLGLGLSISRRGVETCGGELRVRDVPGTGCVFTVDLPRISRPAAA